jgi:trehalose 6-phosphate phosphatase
VSDLPFRPSPLVPMPPLPPLPDLLVPLAESPHRSALCLDFDGTLAAIVVDPLAARPLPGVADLLARLAAHLGLVAVISGRPASFLQSVLASPSGVRLIGLYGLEEVGSDGSRILAPGAAPWEAVITELVALARATAPDGIYVEPKGLTMTLHWRNAPGEADWVSAFVAQQSKARGLAVHSGRHELELRPPLAVDKGTVVRRLVAGFDAVAAFGDDIGDLPAFDALAELSRTGVAVARVAAVDAESPAVVADRADLVVEGPAGAVALLERLAQAWD